MTKVNHPSRWFCGFALALAGIVQVHAAPTADAATPTAPASGSNYTAVAPGLAPMDRIVAVVDEDVILRSELDRALVNVKKQYAGHPEQLPPEAALEKQVLERLILMRLQIARANDTGVKISDADLDQATQRVAEQNHATPAQLQQQLAAEGLSNQQFRKELRDELTVQNLQQKIVLSRVTVSDSEIDNELVTERAGGPQVHLAHILVALPEAATPEQIKLAQSKIDGVKDLIDKGKMEFSAAAIRYSDSPNALEGGDLGWRSLDEVPPAFTEIIKSLKPGQTTQPIRGVSGFQILKVVETRTAGLGAGMTGNDQSQRDAARQTIAKRKSLDEYERFLRQLRSDAYVDVRLGDPAS